MQTYDPHKSTNDVRQASPRMTNARVLVISMTVVVLAFAVIWFFFFMQPNPTAI